MRDRKAISYLVGGLAAALLVVAGCSVKSPTAPEQTPSPPPFSGGASANWAITITASPDQVTVGTLEPATISVRVREVGTGRTPPSGSTMVLSTSLGDFFEPGSEVQSFALSLLGGNGQASLYAGDLPGQAQVFGQLESSFGSTFVDVLGEPVMFITGISPISGPQSGGTSVRITGTGFVGSLRVFFHEFLGTVSSVNSDGTQIVVRTPAVPACGEGSETGCLKFSTEPCDLSEHETGARNIPTAVSVKVESSGDEDMLEPGFTYNPSDRSCRETDGGSEGI